MFGDNARGLTRDSCIIVRLNEAQGKHFILPFNADICAKCRDCHKEASKNSGISRFLNETCGGTLDVGAS